MPDDELPSCDLPFDAPAPGVAALLSQYPSPSKWVHEKAKAEMTGMEKIEQATRRLATNNPDA